MANHKGPFLEFIRATVTLSAANTFTQVTIATPVGRASNLAMLIHSIETEVDGFDTPADQDQIEIQLTKVSQTAMIRLADPNLIYRDTRQIGFVTSGSFMFKNEDRQEFRPPILYAQSNMYFGCKTAGQAAARRFDIRIGYTIEAVDKTTFLEALVD